VASRKIREPKYLDHTFLETIGLLNEINVMVEAVGC